MKRFLKLLLLSTIFTVLSVFTVESFGSCMYSCHDVVNISHQYNMTPSTGMELDAERLVKEFDIRILDKHSFFDTSSGKVKIITIIKAVSLPLPLALQGGLKISVENFEKLGPNHPTVQAEVAKLMNTLEQMILGGHAGEEVYVLNTNTGEWISAGRVPVR